MAATAQAAAPVLYRDQDATPVSAGIPDIAAVAVGNDATSVVIAQSYTATPPANLFSSLFLDLDQNPTTGALDSSGAELAVEYDAVENSFGVYLWDTAKNDWTLTPGTGTRVLAVVGTTTWVIPRSLLGTASGFNFWTLAGVDEGSGGERDEAPDTTTWNYQLQKDTTTTPSAPSTPAFQLNGAKATSTTAKHGASWSAALQTIRSDTGSDLGSEGHVDCSATVGSTPLKLVHAGFATSGTGVFKHTLAVCTWAIPANARGKGIYAVVTTTYKAGKASHTFHAKVA